MRHQLQVFAFVTSILTLGICIATFAEMRERELAGIKVYPTKQVACPDQQIRWALPNQAAYHQAKLEEQKMVTRAMRDLGDHFDKPLTYHF